MERLRPEVFRLPLQKIRDGYKTDVYFNRTAQILAADNYTSRVSMQLFQKVPDATVCGIDHTIALFEMGTGHYSDPQKAAALFERFQELEQAQYIEERHIKDSRWKRHARDIAKPMFEVKQELDQLWVNTFGDLQIDALFDGDKVKARETVMHIRGDLRDFVHLETLYLGILTDGTCVATNTREVVEAAEGTPVLMFGARHSSYESQAGDGYAAYKGGVAAVSTHEQGEYWGSKGIGTIPHALIAAYNGNTVLATIKFDQHINAGGNDINVVSLVDFDNDCVNTSLAVARAMNGRLWGVRVDTSENMIDASLWREIQRGAEAADSETKGVNPKLIDNLRTALDKEGFPEVKIVASGGFNPDKIRRFKRDGVPVDTFGVGSFLKDGSGGKFDYTADVVLPVAKKGRKYSPNPRLERVVI